MQCFKSNPTKLEHDPFSKANTAMATPVASHVQLPSTADTSVAVSIRAFVHEGRICRLVQDHQDLEDHDNEDVESVNNMSGKKPLALLTTVVTQNDASRNCW